MFKIVFYIILFIASLIMLKMNFNINFIVKLFKKNNVIVFGKKRKGKDILFQKVIHKRRREPYFSTMTYGNKYNHIELKDVSVAPNTYNDLINNTITKLYYDPLREKRDIYISDGGQYLPSQYQHLLVKHYPSMPLYYGISGHLYDSNCHVNYNGSFGRLWDKLREQADSYIRALLTIKIGPFFFNKYRFYEEEQSASKNILPLKRSMFMNSVAKQEFKQFNATFGKIKNLWVISFKWQMPYDTRYFKKIFFYDSDKVKPQAISKETQDKIRLLKEKALNGSKV